MVDSGVGITVGLVVVAAGVVELSIDTSGRRDEASEDVVETSKGVVDMGVATGPGADSVEGRSVNDLARPGDVDRLGEEAVVGEGLDVADGERGSAVEAILLPGVEVLDTLMVLGKLCMEAEGVNVIDVVGITVAMAALAVEAEDAPRVVVPVASEAVGWV